MSKSQTAAFVKVFGHVRAVVIHNPAPPFNVEGKRQIKDKWELMAVVRLGVENGREILGQLPPELATRDAPKAGCRATRRFRLAIMTRIKPCKWRRIGEPLSLCLPANNPNDSGAEQASAAEFESRRVAKESIAPRQIWPDGHRATRAIAPSSCPPALHHTEVTDGKVVRGIHRSGSVA
jgi:hypothetical protein